MSSLSHKKPHEAPYLALAGSVAIWLLALLVDKFYDFVKPGWVALGALITIIIIVVQGVVSWIIYRIRHYDEVEGITHQLQALIPPVNVEWLLNDFQLASVEAETPGSEIWIVSPDLSNVTEKPAIAAAVASNAKRGVTYTYIVPKSDEIAVPLQRLLHMFNEHKNRLRISLVPPEEFNRLTITHFALLNPTCTNGADPEVFLELPIEGPGGTRKRGWWIRVAPEAGHLMVGRFRSIAASAQLANKNFTAFK